jgi:antitoxin ParD1/3/4
MASDTSLNLGEHFEHFVDRLVEGGRYSTRGEVLREALRRMEDDEKREEALLRTLDESVASGISSRSSDEIFDRARRIARGELKP